MGFSLSLSFFFLFFLGPHLWYMEVPRVGVKLELQLPAYTRDLSHICDLCHSSWQCWILYPLSEARDQTYILMYTSLVPNHLSHNGNSIFFLKKSQLYWDSIQILTIHPFLSVEFTAF